jgi:hypothetical protein
MKQSDTPINLDGIIRGAASAVGGFIGDKIAGPLGQVAGGKAGGALTGMLLNKEGNRLSKTCYEQFKSLFEAKSIITVQTGLDIYPNMAIVGMTFSRGQNTGRAVDFTVRLRQIKVVQAETLQVPIIRQRNVSDQAGKRQDNGKQPAKEVSASKKSFAKSIFGG